VRGGQLGRGVGVGRMDLEVVVVWGFDMDWELVYSGWALEVSLMR
jgi:hypothetical protein